MTTDDGCAQLALKKRVEPNGKVLNKVKSPGCVAAALGEGQAQSVQTAGTGGKQEEVGWGGAALADKCQH